MLLTTMTAGCQRRSPPPTTAIPGGAPPPTVEWAGCERVRTGPTCELGKTRAVTIWVAAPEARAWTVATGKALAAAKIEPDVDNGTRLIVDVPPGAARLELRDDHQRPVWSLAVADAPADGEVERLLATGRAGQWKEALTGLEALRPKLPPPQQARADAALARVALALGDVDRAEPALGASMAGAKSDGRIGDVVRDGSALVWALAEVRQRFVDARRALTEIEPAARQYPEGQVALDFNAGLLAGNTGDVRTALQRYRAAERRAARLGLRSFADNASMAIAYLLTRVGRFDEALARLRALPAPSEPCAGSPRLVNLAWALTERDARRRPRQKDPEVAQALAAAESATRACPDPHRRSLAVINRADYALGTDDDDEIERALPAVRATVAEHDVLAAAWRFDVLGRALLRRGGAQAALAAFDSQVRAARTAGLIEETFRGEVGAGRALLALGRRRPAVERLNGAAALLTVMFRGIPLGEGQGSFLEGHDDAIRTLVEALVDSGETRAAFHVARRARAAELAYAARMDRLARLTDEDRHRWEEALGRYRRIRGEIERQAEQDWTVPQAALGRLRVEREARAAQALAALDDATRLLAAHDDAQGVDLSDPAAGECFIAFFPGPRDWLIFAATSKTVTVTRAAESFLSSREQAAAALTPLSRLLSSVKRARFLPYGAADRIEWQAVAWNGRPLIRSLEVEYGLDVPSRYPRAPRKDSAAAPVLLVADPTGDLPGARREADQVAAAVAGQPVTRLIGPAATREALLAALPRSALFHYAGHADVPTDAPGLSHGLRLAGGARLDIGDVLSMPRTPELVVLSACEAADPGVTHPSLMGLAQAFIAGGARAAVAPTRPIGDSAARRFAGAFYAKLGRSKAMANPEEDLEKLRSSFREALLELSAVQGERPAAEGTEAGLESVRLLVP